MPDIIHEGDTILLEWCAKGSQPDLEGTVIQLSDRTITILLGEDNEHLTAYVFRKSDGFSNPNIGYRLPERLIKNKMATLKKTTLKKTTAPVKETKEKPAAVPVTSGRKGRPSTRTARAPMKITAFTDAPAKNVLELNTSSAGYLRFSETPGFKITPRKREVEPDKAHFVDQWQGAADLGATVELRLDKAAATYAYTIALPQLREEMKKVGRGSGPLLKTIDKIEMAIQEKFGLKTRKAVSSPEKLVKSNSIANKPVKRGPGRPKLNPVPTSTPTVKKRVEEVKAKTYTPKPEKPISNGRRKPMDQSGKIKLKKAVAT